MDEFMMAGDELCDIADDLAGPARTMKRRRDMGGAKVVLGPPKGAGRPDRRWKTTPIASPHGKRIPVRGGNPMKGPTSTPVSDGYTISLRKPLGARLTNLGDWPLGKRIPGPKTVGAFVMKPTLVPFQGGRMLPGLGNMLPGVAGLGDWPLGKRIPTPKTQRLLVKRSKQLSPARGNMLPGLAADNDYDVMDVGYLSADDLYDQVDGEMLPGVGGIFDEANRPALVIAGVALLAFFMMARKRYA